MAGPRLLEKGFKFWVQQPGASLTVQQVIDKYEQGFAGAYKEPEEEERFNEHVIATGGNPDGESVAYGSGFVGSSEGKLILPFIHAIEALGGNPWPGAAQERGDCTTHGDKNANLVTWGVETNLALPDEVTGRIEGLFDITPQGVSEGAFAPEASWWIRIMLDGGGDGWSCDAAAMASCKYIGLWPRRNYPELGFDLTEYSNANTKKYGRSIPEAILAVGKEHLIRTATRLKGYEQTCDFLNNGYGVNSCGGQAWSSTRNEYGYSPTKAGGWSHSEGYIGADRRPWIAQKFNMPAWVLQMNSWGVWNGGPRDIHDSAQFVPPEKRDRWIQLDLVNSQTGNIMIPKGSRWVDARTLDRRSLHAKSSVAGWPARKIDSFMGGDLWG